MSPASFRIPLSLLAATAGVLLLQAGCTGGLGSVTTPPRISPSTAIEPGHTIGVRAPGTPAQVSAAKLSGRVGSPGEGAVHGMKTLAGAGWNGESAVVGVALLPIAALVGAAAEVGREVPPEELLKTEAVLAASLRAAAAQGAFRDHFLQVAAARTNLKFVALANTPTVTPPARGREWTNANPDWFLDLAIEEMHLRGAALSDSYTLAITARARLIRAADATVVYDQTIEFRSGASRAVDWSANQGGSLRSVAQYGSRVIAEQFVECLVADSPR
jgi:hypothetical protein